MVKRQIAWLHFGNDRKLVFAHVTGMLGVFLLGYWARWILGPAGTVLFVRSASILVHHNLAGAARRLEAQADRSAVKTLADPEALITALSKLERMKLQAPSKQFTRRIQKIAREAGIDEAKVAALMEQASESTDRYPTPELKLGELTVWAC